MNTKKLSTIIAHEYSSKIKSKGFIIGTFLAPIAIVLIFGVTIAVTLLTQDSTSLKLAVVDKTEFIGNKLVESDTSKYYLTNLSELDLKDSVNLGSIDGYIVIEQDILEEGKLPVYTKGGGGIGFTESLDNNLSRILRDERMNKYGASDSLRRALRVGLYLDNKKVTETGEIEDDTTSQLTFVGYILGFVIYMLMFIYGSMISRSVVEEKANRIIEIIASSAKPFEILLGKVLAVGSLGLTQILTWVILIGGIMIFAGPIVSMFVDIDPASLQGGMTADEATQEKVNELMSNFPDISLGLILGFIFYFLAGYFIYATIFAALGSAVDNEQDAAQLQTPVSLFIIMPIIMIQGVMANPDATWVIAVSHFPLFAPILMVVRIAATNVPAWEIVLSVVILTSSFFGSLWVSSKIYRIGILMTGKKPKFKDIWKWLKMS
jgi:ABC-2 type transport system permease protein